MTQSRFEQARHSGDTRTALRLNRDFHFGVYRLARMSMLMHQIETLWTSMDPILKVYLEEVITDYVGADQDVRLIEALKRRNGAEARAALEGDIVRGGEGILRHLTILDSAACA